MNVAACSAFCDFVFALLPWRLLLRFDIYNKEKVGVAIAMSMGVLYVSPSVWMVLQFGDYFNAFMSW